MRYTTLFSDRFRYPRVLLTCFLLWICCVYSRVEGEIRYPSHSICLADPERFDGVELYFRNVQVLRSDASEFLTKDRWGERISTRGRIPHDWVGARISFVGDFIGGGAGQPPQVRLRTGPDGRPVARIEKEYVNRRALMYGSSAAVLLLWVLLFRREFEVRLPHEWIVARKGSAWRI